MGSLLAKVIFQPPVATYGGSSTKLHYLKTKSGAEVPCIYIDNQAEFTILFSHGNAEDIGMVIAWFQPFSQKVEVNLLAYDYEGYGVAKNDRNTKEPMEPSEQVIQDSFYIYIYKSILYSFVHIYISISNYRVVIMMLKQHLPI